MAIPIRLANVLFFVVILFCDRCGANDNAKRLFENLMSTYNRFRRPGKHDETLTIRLKLRLAQIIAIHEKNQIMTTSVWLKQQWVDRKLTWAPARYGGVQVIDVPSQMIWVPDMVLYNNADSDYNITIATKAEVNFNGTVTWEPPAIFKSMCSIDIQWFPFDEQLCRLKFGSWTHSEESVNLEHLEGQIEYVMENDTIPQNVTFVREGIDLSEYYPHVEWDIVSIEARRHGKTYPSCCPNSPAYIDITYYLGLRRKPLFYTINLIFPCLAISMLTVIVFYLPSKSCSKMNLVISVLVSLTVFFLLLIDIIPSTSLVLPLIGQYLLFTMVMVTLSVTTTVITLNVHHRTPATHQMPRWVKRVFLSVLPSVLLMRRPLQSHKSLRQITQDRLRHNVHSAVRADLWAKIGIPTASNDHPFHAFAFGSLPGPRGVLHGEGAGAGKNGVWFRGLRRAWRSYGEDDWRQQRIGAALASPRVTKAFENVYFISELLKRKDKQDKVRAGTRLIQPQIDEDWKYVAMVLDRLLLFIFTIVCILGSAIILLQAPSLRNHKPAIDAQYARGDFGFDDS